MSGGASAPSTFKMIPLINPGISIPAADAPAARRASPSANPMANPMRMRTYRGTRVYQLRSFIKGNLTIDFGQLAGEYGRAFEQSMRRQPSSGGYSAAGVLGRKTSRTSDKLLSFAAKKSKYSSWLKKTLM